MLRTDSVAHAPSVLVIDDDVTVLDTFQRMLRLEGFEVRTASNAQAGLDAAADAHPDAILLDLRMPLSDGMAFLRTLRSETHDVHTPVAIVTGDYFIDDALVDEAQALGATINFKPLWLEDLVTVTRDLISR